MCKSILYHFALCYPFSFLCHSDNQIRITNRYLTLVRMVNIKKKSGNNQCWQGSSGKEYSFAIDWNIWLGIDGKLSWFLKIVEIELLYNPSVLFLEIEPQQTHTHTYPKTLICKNLHILVLIVVLFNSQRISDTPIVCPQISE